MESHYHRTIKRSIVSLAKKSGKYKIHVEGKIPLTHPNFERMFFYKPDVHLETKFGKIYIFEILDAEMKDMNLVISDIIQSYISPNVSKIFFIVNSKDDADKVYKWSSVIGGRLEQRGMKKIPEVTVYTITRRDAKSKRLTRILENFSKEDGW